MYILAIYLVSMGLGLVIELSYFTCIFLSLVPKSRSSVKVKIKYQGHSFRKNGHCRGIIVSQKQLVSGLLL